MANGDGGGCTEADVSQEEDGGGLRERNGLTEEMGQKLPFGPCRNSGFLIIIDRIKERKIEGKDTQ